MFLSTDNGTSWIAVNTGLTNIVRSLVISGTNIFAGTWGAGMFLSTDSGTSWTAVNTGLTNTSIQSLAVSGSNVFAGTYGGGVFLSNNNGASWTAVNSGLPNTFISSLALSGTNIFAGTCGEGVWIRPLSEITEIDDASTMFNIINLYPHPSSDIVTLNIDRNSNTDMTLNIYSVMGSLVKVEKLKQNKEQININNLSNGIYIIEIVSKGLSERQKLIIQR